MTLLKSKRKRRVLGHDSVEKSLQDFLMRRNCVFTVEESDDNHMIRYVFDYQGGHFVALLYQDVPGVEVVFPRFVFVPMKLLQEVRSCCNHYNTSMAQFKFIYAIDEESNTISVSQAAYVPMHVTDCFSHLLESFFVVNRDFCDFLENVSSHAEGLEADDFESHLTRQVREMFLLRQQEFKSQDVSLQWRPNDLEHLTMGQFFYNMFSDLHEAKFCRLQVITEGLSLVEGHEVIAGTDLSSFLISDTGGTPVFVRAQAVAVLHFVMSQVSGGEERVMIFNFRQAGNDDSSLYYRISALLEAEEASRFHSLNSKDAMFSPVTVLVARDFAGDEKRLQEFDYMWKDAQIKKNEGREHELTGEQRLIGDVTDVNVAHCLYWGRRYMSEKRYYEAIIYLKNAFCALRLSFFELSKEMKKNFFDICYYIGFCYCDLKLYDKAFYYLHIISVHGRIDYSMEYVNMLANSGDIRIFTVIERMLEDIDENFGDDDEIPDNIQDFFNFLRRRRAFAFISFGKLDKAEKEFKAMLNEPDNRDYAIKELAFIQRQRIVRPDAEAGEQSKTEKDKNCDWN